MSTVTGEAKKIRVAVVGSGEFGRNHARVYREIPGAELVGVYDKDPDRAAQVATEFRRGHFRRLKSCEDLLTR